MYHYTYQIKNLINNKTYIGVHSTNNLNDKYFGSGRALRAAIKKYKKKNFRLLILDFFSTKEEAYLEEEFLINKEWVSRKDNYNLLIGGLCNGRVGKDPWNKNKTNVYSKESILKMKLSQTGVAAPNRKKVINTLTGKTYNSITELANSEDCNYKLCYLAEMLRGDKPNKTLFKLL